MDIKRKIGTYFAYNNYTKLTASVNQIILTFYIKYAIVIL
jgi:hypothetical protein